MINKKEDGFPGFGVATAAMVLRTCACVYTEWMRLRTCPYIWTYYVIDQSGDSDV